MTPKITFFLKNELPQVGLEPTTLHSTHKCSKTIHNIPRQLRWQGVKKVKGNEYIQWYIDSALFTCFGVCVCHIKLPRRPQRATGAFVSISLKMA